jgi:uncharacterized protein DUF5658
MGGTAERRLAGNPGFVVLAALAIVSAADIATTHAALAHGARELSPLGRHVVDHGVAAMVMVKLAAVAAVGIPRWFGRRICLTGLAAMTAVASLSNAVHLSRLF